MCKSTAAKKKQQKNTPIFQSIKQKLENKKLEWTENKKNELLLVAFKVILLVD